MRVFIADDSIMVCERLTALLAPLDGVKVIGRAHDVSEATEAIVRLKPDLVVLDIQMSGGSGFDVLKTVKNGGSSPVVIVMTNYPFPQYRRKYLDAGADYFFDKSTEFTKVMAVCRQYLAGRREPLIHAETRTIKPETKIPVA